MRVRAGRAEEGKRLVCRNSLQMGAGQKIATRKGRGSPTLLMERHSQVKEKKEILKRRKRGAGREKRKKRQQGNRDYPE